MWLSVRALVPAAPSWSVPWAPSPPFLPKPPQLPSLSAPEWGPDLDRATRVPCLSFRTQLCPFLGPCGASFLGPAHHVHPRITSLPTGPFSQGPPCPPPPPWPVALSCSTLCLTRSLIQNFPPVPQRGQWGEGWGSGLCRSWWERLLSCGSSCKVPMKQLFTEGQGNKGVQ